MLRPALSLSVRDGPPPVPVDVIPFGVPIRCICNEIEEGDPYWEVTLQTEDGVCYILRLSNHLPLGRWMVRVRNGHDYSPLSFIGDADTPQQLRAQLGESIIWAGDPRLKASEGDD